MSKGINQYSVKSSENQIKDLDLNAREVAIYLSKFDVIDSDNDLIVKGAFNKSIKERGVASETNRKIAFLRHHDWQHQIGKFTTIQEDDKGLFAVGKLGTSTKGEDALRDYQDGIILEHSIGFQYLEDGIKWIEDEKMEKGGYYRVDEVKLFEGSAVTFGANEHCDVLSVSKGAKKEDIIKDISKQIDVVTKAIINGRGTDERLYDLEMKLKYLNSRLIDLAITDYNIKSSDIVDVQQIDIEQSFNWSKVNTLLDTKETYADYPKQAVNNAKRGIKLNEENNNKCATDVGKQRARDIVAKRGFSLSVLNRVYSYLSRAKAYYNPDDDKACGTISYLLWGGEAMRVWAGKKLEKIDNN